ncbi:protealysin inhibitor emfourin [Nonomuraea rhizosphaerae]|uniref:protealysin inhibitor emfourin n=1 Tax=Nonomuraea rhizosphaerae TaxID=2665663 RepID=UPI001C5E4773|nr:protealysin inhibitor emfourin [Nonomuraea rhizosphaerae]
MRVTLQTSGGFTGRRLHASLDTDDPAHLRALAQLPAQQLSGGQPPADQLAERPGSAQPRYRLTVHHPDGDQVSELTESTVPPALRPLLAQLLRNAHP